MSFLLITNDDGVDSPALIPFIREMSELASVRTVVPATERSWIGKAITRFDEVRVETIYRDGFEIQVADAYPADCVQLGVHSLYDDRPEMVVSGINVGLNAGLAFFLGSGTVGAAVEGWISGLPAVAFSTGVVSGHRPWAKRSWDGLEGEQWDRAARVAADVLRTIRAAGFPDGVDLLSVNFPTDADESTPRLVTSLAVSGYDNIFAESEPGRFVHDFSGGLRFSGDLSGSDLAVLVEGNVAITPVRLARSVSVDDDWRNAVER